MSDLNPQNPYISAMVSASAGSGKTYQLSRRFLGLVAAGADPSTILAVTFSKKAAAEMRERIVQDAIALGIGSIEFNDFYDQLMGWHRTGVEAGLTLPPLRSALQVSELITSSSQSLSITTIDAILMEWCLKFPWETRISDGDTTLMQPWEIATREEALQHTREAWKNAIQRILDTQNTPEARAQLLSQILMAAPEEQLTVAWQRMGPLRQSETFIWLCNHLRGTAALPYSVEESAAVGSFEELIDSLGEDLQTIVCQVSNAEKKSAAFAAIAVRSFEGLVNSGIFTNNYQLHKGTISKKIRADIGEIVDWVDTAVGQFIDRKRLATLNTHSAILWQLYKAWSHEHLAAKSRAAKGSFADALKGVWQLFCERNPGARWLIQNRVKHLLLDEFQDTSRLQWSAFAELAKDIMSGTSNEQDPLPGTVFIVGDAKQSIYGFREAAPEIMNLAGAELAPHGFKHLEMSTSWRTAPIVLEVVNAVFANNDLIANFPIHATAQVGTKKNLVVPDIGSVTVLAIPESSGEKDLAKEHVTLEALSIATHIQKCLSGEISCPIWDKKLGIMRSPEPRDFAVLYHAKTDAGAYEDALRSLHIPGMREERKGFYSRQEIRDTIAFLKWLTWPGDTLALCTILRCPVGGLNDRDLQELILPRGNAATESNHEFASTELILERLGKSKKGLAALLQLAQSKAHHESYLNILLWWFKANNILNLYRSTFGDLEGELASANLIKFADTIRSCEALGHGALQTVIEQLNVWSEDDETGNASTAANAVHLMTLHKSKGLEFPIVILVGLAGDWFRSDHYWLRSIANGKEGLSYIGTSADQPLNDSDFNSRVNENELVVRAEKARLLYVGMTRSQFHLVVSAGFKATKSNREPSPESYYSRIRDAVLQSGGQLVPYGIRLEKAVTQTTAVTESSPTLSAPSENLINLAQNRKTPLWSASSLPAMSILTATAKAGAIADSLKSTSALDVKGSFEPASKVEHPLVYGQCIHRILEFVGSEGDLSMHALSKWMRHQLVDAKKLPPDVLERIASLAIIDAARCKRSAAWETIFFGATHVFRECSLALIAPSDDSRHRATQNLVIGQPDLVIEKSDGTIWVVDYKTGLLNDASDALTYCKLKGYDVQVQTYASALKRLYPHLQIRSWILMTQTALLVEV